MRNLINPMPPRHLPGLNAAVSVVGAGCWPLGGACRNAGVPIGWADIDDHTATQVLTAAYEAGITYYDTADVYGHGLSERRLGVFLTQVPRDAVTIASKVGYHAADGRHPYHPDRMRDQLTTTLANLGTDHLDVYAFHSTDFGVGDAYLDDAVAAMNTFVEAGLVRVVGMRAPHEFAAEWATGPSTPRGRAAARFLHLFTRLAPAVVTARYNMLSPAYDAGETHIFAFARRYGCGVLTKQVLGQGLLTGAHDHDSPRIFGPGDHRGGKPQFGTRALRIVNTGLRPLREHFGAAPADLASAAVRYAVHTTGAVALVGFRTAGQVAATVAHLPARLSHDEVALIRRTGQDIRSALATLPPAAQQPERTP